jgi:DNA-binding MarR family transcriptional regulator
MAAVRLSRLQTRILQWLAADEQRTRGMSTSRPPELVAALPSAQGNLSHSLRRLETQGLIVMIRTPGGKTESIYLTAAGHQKARKLAGRDEEGGTSRKTIGWERYRRPRAWERC